MKKAILIVDDHDISRRGLQALLQESFPRAKFDVAGTKAELFVQLSKRSWSLVILDLEIADSSGLETIADIKVGTQNKVLVFSSSSEDELGVRAIQAGADGYIQRNVAVAELVAAVQQVLGGHCYVSQQLALHMAEALVRPRSTGIAALSNRELYVLRRIGQGRTTGEIAVEMSLSVKTVSTYRSRVLEKLHLHTTAELVRFAIEHNISG